MTSLAKKHTNMPPLLLLNGHTELRKDQNLCFVNASLQILYSIDFFREFFSKKALTDFTSNQKICRELWKIINSAKQVNTMASASILRRYGDDDNLFNLYNKQFNVFNFSA